MKLSPKQHKALELVAEGRFLPRLAREDDGWYARWVPVSRRDRDDAVLAGWVDEFVRNAAMTRMTEDAEHDRHETLHDAWMAALRSRSGLVIWADDACAAFAAELDAWGGSAAEDEAARGRIVFSLEPADANGASATPFALTCDVPKGRAALRALGQAAYVCGPVRGLHATADGRLAVALTRTETEAFLRTGARELVSAGYSVAGVDLAAPVSASAELTTPARRDPSAPPRTQLVVHVAGQPVSADEIRFLLDQGSSLVFFREHWIEVDRNILKEALRALEKGLPKNTNPISFALGLGHVGRLEIEKLRLHGWLRGFVNELRAAHGNARESICPPFAVEGFRGELRAYQKRGARWLDFLTANGFGALLADDMGLGKTAQTIAWILAARAARPVLVLAPLTLLENWRHEFAKFAPTLRIAVHQGDGRHRATGFRRLVSASDVVITSYNLLVRDYTFISAIDWQALVLDEAQVIKNPDTQVARAVKALSPRMRIALTGTPIENSVADIWSIEDFLNPGFLGDRKSFADRFVKPIAASATASAVTRLRHALEPFVLRRLKTEGEIAAELGEKREIREYCELTPAQRQAYESALADFRASPHQPGDVLALVTALKLVCDGEGKMNRLRELLEQIFANGESALVFTQYAKVGAWICRELTTHFGRKIPFLHGGLGVKAREGEIAAFNRSGARAFVLSLRTGGFGLNLTKATHVIHFDRWWNPAVENQATDRAHRIGQEKTVFVHVFITSGTLEEHVDEILQKKALVAGSVITEAEWLEAAKLDEPA